jgi:hypothetical protein
MWLPGRGCHCHKPFRPIAIRVLDKSGNISEVIRSVEPFTVRSNIELEKSLKGLRVGIYLLTTVESISLLHLIR